jgi:hypothetical protein
VDALTEVADELYGLAPEEFTAARNARAKAAQAGGDRDLAEAIKGLARPSAAAWLANQLVRRDPEALEPLLELGTALRDASARLDGAEMRSLSRQQPKVVANLVKRATAIGREAGKAVSAGTEHDLEDTLRAAVADADAAEQLLSGCLANGLQHNGFGLVAAGNLSLVRTAPDAGADLEAEGARGRGAGRSSAPKPGRDERRVEQLAEAERDLEDAQAAVDVTSAGRDNAAAEVETAEAGVDEARTELDDLRERMEQAKFALSRAEGELRQAKQGLEQSARAARAAANALADATAKRDRLQG